MDVNDLRVAATLASFAVFLGLCVWAWCRRNRARFDEAAQLPFEDTRPSSRSFS
ncbi:cbb3-type cytochrome c oxidase subunit 3 [Aquabacterium sp. J223]|uniref:cbb3-type cytochrome oxidase subunit 3 n=1 Tax=Aquabacterium sp. J223 TaxID=2898431 RepID=UPI0021ADAE1F|nr:cbb3-type cytochrome c oxidase subunit 3 [Aquabacterium sp. J223]UUX97911.1 cbb3-type cytochrome c oxidase subunit 3 [Aquabacterium sp. J223]